MMISWLMIYIILFFSFHAGLLINVFCKFCHYLKLPFLNFEIQEAFAGQIDTTVQKLDDIYYKH